MTCTSPSRTPCIPCTSTRTSWRAAPAPFRDGRYGGADLPRLHGGERVRPRPAEVPGGPVYLCFPNNPTGATIDRGAARRVGGYARKSKALILYDAAYVSFIRDESCRRSIFEIPRRRASAPSSSAASPRPRGSPGRAARSPWCRRTAWRGTRTAPRIRCCTPVEPAPGHEVQRRLLPRAARRRGRLHAPGPQGDAGLSDYYLGNAQIIREKLAALGFPCTGGDNSPYIWVKTEMDSWRVLRPAARRRPASSSRRAAGSAGAARATSASARSTSGSGWRRPWRGSRQAARRAQGAEPGRHH